MAEVAAFPHRLQLPVVFTVNNPFWCASANASEISRSWRRLSDAPQYTVAPMPCAPMSMACRTVPHIVWSCWFGYDSSSLWLTFTMKGILWAYLRASSPRTPKVDATALQPPSRASFTIVSGSKYAGFGANDEPAECSMP